MSTRFKTSMFGGFDRSDVIAYIEKTGREHEERVAALEAENETLRKENQTLENTQRVTQAQLLKMQDNEETCRRLRRQLADAEARNQELEQRCAQLKVQAARLQAYMSAGRPVLAMIGNGGADVIKEANCGYAVPAGDYEALATIIRNNVLVNKEAFETLGYNGRCYFEREFQKDICIDNLCRILKEDF